MSSADASFDSSRFRHVLGHFATGVAVITANGPAGPAGMVVSSFTSVSLEPPLVAFLPDKSSTSWPAIEAAGSFCVNILSAGQLDLCAQFSRSGADKFAGVSWEPAPSGSPVLHGVMAWIDCELTQTFESGDHYIAIGRVSQLEAAEAVPPLVFFQGGYKHLEAAAPPEGSDPWSPVGLHSLEESGGPDDDTAQQYASATEGLMDEIVGGYVREFHQACLDIAASAETAGRAVDELLRIAFESLDANRAAIMILQNERPYLSARAELAYLKPLERDIDMVWRSALERGVEGGDFRPDLDVSVAYRFIRDVIFAAARRYRSVHKDGDADAYRTFIVHGLLRP